MKKNLMQKSIITFNTCVFLLCSSVTAMDKPTPEIMFSVKGTDSKDSDEGVKVSQSTLEMSNTLKNLLDDMKIDTSKPIPLDLPPIPLRYPIEDISIQQNIDSFSLQNLIQASNFLEEDLHLKDPEIIKKFINGLKQKLSQLSPQELGTNENGINSLDNQIQQKIAQPLRDKLISNKRIENLKTNGIRPEQKTAFDLDGFHPYSGAFSHDGKQIALGDTFGRIKILNAQTGEPIVPIFSGHNQIVKSIIFSHDDKLLITAYSPDKIIIWDTHTYKQIQSLDITWSYPTSIVLSPDDKFIAAILRKNMINTFVLWQKEENKISYERVYSIDNYYNFIGGFNADGTKILLHNSEVQSSSIWKIDKNATLSLYAANIETPPNVSALQFSPDDTKIIGLSHKHLAIWDTKTLKPDSKIENIGNENIKLSPDGSICIAINRTEVGPINKYLLEVKTGSKICNVSSFPGYAPYIRNVNFFSPDNSTLVTIGPLPELKLIVTHLLLQEDQAALEKELKKLSLSELLQKIAIKKEELRAEKEQRYLAKFFPLKLHLRAMAAEKFADIRNKLASWWKYLTEQAE